MSVTAEQTTPPEVQQDWPPCYEITVRTWLTDAEATADLAVQISEGLAGNDQVDATATSICLEDGQGEPERVYLDIVGQPPTPSTAEVEPWPCPRKTRS
jgi:hypothetical protein